MTPRQLTLIRHAQGLHKLNVDGHQFHDPRLTLKGQQQCSDLALSLPDMNSIDCIIASPLRRDLYTALLVFDRLLRSRPDLRIIALPELQETSDLPCDTGSAVIELEREFFDKPVDFSLVPHDWIDKTAGIFAPQSVCVAARCRKARHFLASLRADSVAVVAHGTVFHYLIDEWAGATDGVDTGWHDCETRTYRFDTSTKSNIAEAAIVETDESQVRRIAKTCRSSREQQLEIQLEAEAAWAADGHIILSHNDTKDSAYLKSDEEAPCAKTSSSKPQPTKWYKRKCCIL